MEGGRVGVWICIMWRMWPTLNTMCYVLGGGGEVEPSGGKASPVLPPLDETLIVLQGGIVEVRNFFFSEAADDSCTSKNFFQSI